MSYYNVIFYVAIFMGLIPFILLFLKKKLFDIKEPIVFFVWLTVVATLYEVIGTRLLKINVQYWFQLYSLLEFLGLYYFFTKALGQRYKNLYRFFFLLFVLVYIISFFYWGETNTLFRKAMTKIVVSSFVFISFILWLRNLFEKKKNPDVFKTPDFYFMSGVIIYFSGTFLTFLSANYISTKTSESLIDYWVVIIYSSIVFRTLLSIAVWKMKPN